MFNRSLHLAIVCLLLVTFARAESFKVGSIDEPVEVSVLKSDDLGTTIRFDVGTFDADLIEIDGKQFHQLKLTEESNLLLRGEPDLPHICRAIIIPDDARMEIKVISSEFTEFENFPVAPSKGNFDRTILPADVPFTFGNTYESNEFYPSQIAAIREPFIMRDFRGTVVEINPFQYNPANKILRVYTSVTVEVTPAGPGIVNIFPNRKSGLKLVPDFDRIYRDRFINYEYQLGKYTPVMESGDMLIICNAAYMDEMQPFVDWKLQKGIKTTLVSVSSIGNNYTAIGNFIDDFYDSTSLAWILLVGDYAEVTTEIVGGGGTDPNYTRILGTDYYPEAFIGRFSAQSVANVTTQVDRVIDYEKHLHSGDWLHMGTGIASSGGPGHFGEYDYEHADLIRDDLLAFTYTQVDRLYETTGATSSQVAAAVNNGRSFINYTGHGSDNAWSTTGFSSTNVNALINDYMLPFIISVACVNGNFTSGTCFGEAWLRATNNSSGVPTGAIGAYMSTVNQSWDPPMDAQDECTDLLVAEAKTTFGGICFNGSCKMMDLNSSDGPDEFIHWTIFGDPSVLLRTDVSQQMTVSHESVILFSLSEFDIQVTGVPGSLAAIYHNGVLYGSAYTDQSGNATIVFTEALPIGEAVSLTVTAFNYEPYITTLQVITPDGPYCVMNDYAYLDEGSDGIVDAAETVTLSVEVKNVGPDPAYDVDVTLTSTDPYVTITDGAESYGTIDGNDGTVMINDGFAVDIAANTPDGHIIPFDLVIEGTDTRLTWDGGFTLTVRSQPDLGITDTYITEDVDSAGTMSCPMTIYNYGPSPLDFSVSRQMFSGKSALAALAPLRPSPLGFTPGDADKGSDPEPLYAGTDKGSGGPDQFGYFWVDSDHPDGPAVEWIDISTVGTAVTLEDDDSTGAISIGFSFPFYANYYDELHISSNGHVTFGQGSKKYSNTDIPNSAAPNNLIAPFWDDLDPEQYGDIYYYYDAANSRFIVAFVNVAFHYSTTGTGSINCEVILTPDGAIVLQYGVMSAGSDVLTSSTIGIENAAGTDGLEVVYNGAYIHDNMAIRFKAADWLSVTPGNGTVPPFGNVEISLGFAPGDLECGSYGGQVTIQSNDPDTPEWVVPVTMNVVAVPTCMCGDVDNNELYNILDITYLITYKFKSGPAPEHPECADIDGEPGINVLDIVYLVNNKYKSGPDPICD